MTPTANTPWIIYFLWAALRQWLSVAWILSQAYFSRKHNFSDSHLELKRLSIGHQNNLLRLLPTQPFFFSSVFHRGQTCITDWKMKLWITFIWETKWTWGQETAFQIALISCSERHEARSVYMWFWWRWGNTPIKHKFLQKVAASHVKVTADHEEHHITMKDAGAFLDTRKCKNWAH